VDRHEIPTHLNVEDKAFGGMTMRQLMTLAVGLGLAYGAASGLPLPVPAQATIAVLVLAGVAVAALWRPGGRPFEDWAFVLLRYWAMPRLAVWRRRHPSTAPRASQGRFEVMLPALDWLDSSIDDGNRGGSDATR
jgi:hypothetical protein